MNYLRLFGVFLRIGLLNELAYRTNFYVQLFQSVLSLITAFAGLAVVFSHTDNLGGWQPAELAALVGVFLLMGGLIGLVIQPGMERLMEDVRQGTLDFTLTKPEDAQVLVSLGEVRIWKAVDVVMGAVVIGLALVEIGVDQGLLRAVGFGISLAAGTAIVYSFWLMLATLSFWFVRLENVLVIFQSLYDAGRWPVGIYPQWLQAALTFLVPVAFAVTVPSQALVGRLSLHLLLGAVGLALFMLLASRLLWRWGIKHYSGASA